MKSSSVLVAALFAVTSASACEPSLDTGESELALGSTEPRLELYQTSTKLEERSTKADVFSIPSSSVQLRFDGNYDLLSTPFDFIGNGPPGFPLCTDASFYQQPRLFAGASGILVGEDLVLTVWHAMHSQIDCDNRALILDHAVAALPTPTTSPMMIPGEDVFFCSEFVATGGGPAGSTNDWSVIRLDHPVNAIDRVPLKVRRTGQVTAGSPALLIGHPHRLLAKIEETTVSPTGPYVFGPGNIWVGSSGSMSVNVGTGRVEGIVFSGAIPSPIFDPVGMCYRECVEPSCGGSYISVGALNFAPGVPVVGLEVKPVRPASHFGPPGGPFSNPTRSYELSVSTASRPVEAATLFLDALLAQGPSIDLPGPIPPGGTRVRNIVLVASEAAALPIGVRETSVTFRDTPYATWDKRVHLIYVGVDGFSADVTTGPVITSDTNSTIYALTNQYVVAQVVEAATETPWIWLNESGQAVTLTLPAPSGADYDPTLRVALNPVVKEPPVGSEAAIILHSGPASAPWHTVTKHVQWDGTRLVPLD